MCEHLVYIYSSVFQSFILSLKYIQIQTALIVTPFSLSPLFRLLSFLLSACTSSSVPRIERAISIDETLAVCLNSPLLNGCAAPDVKDKWMWCMSACWFYTHMVA